MKTMELVFILDKSGSMCGKEEDVIGGFNSTINEQKSKSKEYDCRTLVTTELFSDDQIRIHDRVDINDIKVLTSDDYKTNGCTALIDTIGKTINHISDIHKYQRDEDKPFRTLFVIMTDGMENASHEYSSDDVKKMISQKKELEWEFLFLGANIDSVETAKTYGIDESRVSNYETSSKGIKKAHKAINKVLNVISNPDLTVAEVCCCMENGEWKEDLKEYNK